MSELYIIETRLQEVRQAIDSHKLNLEALQEEAGELETAAKVIVRLSGAERPSPRAADPSGPQEAPCGKPDALPTMPKMIGSVIKEAQAHGNSGLTPKDVTEAISKRWWPEVQGAAVSSIMWRMWKREQLVKGEGSPLYSLPQKVEANDDVRSQDASLASLFNPAQGRVAGPGGGT